MITLTQADLGALSASERKAAMMLARRGDLAFETGDDALWRLPDWQPQQKQSEFLLCPADEVLYGGAAGGGKSDAIINFSIRRRYAHPGSRGLIIRRSLAELEKAGGLCDRAQELLGDRAKYNATKHRFTFPDGGIIEFGYCEKERDVTRYLSSQYDDICIDEAGQLSGYQMRMLISRCRTVRPDLRTKIRLATNPGGPGHSYLKARFVDAAAPGVVYQPPASEIEPEPRSRAFIPAKLSDNPTLTQADPHYAAFLASLPEKERKAYADGDWNAFAGMYFPEWSPSVHVVEPFEIPANWNKIVGLDWGFNHPTVVLFAAVDPDGQIWLYHELRLRYHHVGDLVERIRDVEPSAMRAAAGPDVFTMAKEYLGGPPISEEFQRNGIILDDVMRGRKRIHGWQQVRRYLQWSEEKPPLLRVFRGACPTLCEQMPAMNPADNDPEDMEKVDIDPGTGQGGDDAVDALRHLLMGRPYRGREEAPAPPTGWNMAALQYQKDQERRKKARRALR